MGRALAARARLTAEVQRVQTRALRVERVMSAVADPIFLLKAG